MFMFRAEIRNFVKSLAELAEYANDRNIGRWHWQSSDANGDGVYGSAIRTIEYIIREEYGAHILDRIEWSRYGFNFGGCRTWLDSVEVAVEEAIHAHREAVWDALRDYADMWE